MYAGAWLTNGPAFRRPGLMRRGSRSSTDMSPTSRCRTTRRWTSATSAARWSVFNGRILISCWRILISYRKMMISYWRILIFDWKYWFSNKNSCSPSAGTSTRFVAAEKWWIFCWTTMISCTEKWMNFRPTSRTCARPANLRLASTRIRSAWMGRWRFLFKNWWILYSKWWFLH